MIVNEREKKRNHTLILAAAFHILFLSAKTKDIHILAAQSPAEEEDKGKKMQLLFIGFLSLSVMGDLSKLTNSQSS